MYLSVKPWRMENFEWRNEQRQWDWDNPFLPVEAHLSLPIWGGCPGCNYGDTAMGGLDLSCQAGQITPSLTVWGPRIRISYWTESSPGHNQTFDFPGGLSLSLHQTPVLGSCKLSLFGEDLGRDCAQHTPSMAYCRRRGSIFKSCHSLWNRPGLEGPQDLLPGCDFKVQKNTWFRAPRPPCLSLLLLLCKGKLAMCL